jgi:peptidoglycan/xylan/chitin deacetylase (PgdA/CDA1 family)
MKFACAITAGLLLFISLWRPAEVSASPVLLSFDVEEPGDELALRRLDVKVPATYFITGAFAENHRELVAALSKGDNTIGSHSYNHPHFRSLAPDSIRQELALSKQLIESISGKPVEWFRAPYLEYDERVLQSLRETGYLGDSSDKDSWADQAVIFEMPISNFRDSSLIASDYDMLEEGHDSGSQFRDTLRKMYFEKARNGQPLVVLLHPSVCSKQIESLNEFISSVRKSGATFMSLDGYLSSLQQHRPLRRAAWLDAENPGNPASTAEALSRLGTTDVFLMATDASGKSCFSNPDGRDRFGRTVASLKSKGVKVHAWISVLADRKALEQHPEWGMISKTGTRSTEWMSPAIPEVVRHVAATMRRLMKEYQLDGICMDNLAFPNAEFDYLPEIVKAYAQHEKLNHLPPLTELMNDDYTSWCEWRSTVIADLAGKLRKAAMPAGKHRVEFSTVVPGNSAINYREPEITGQNVALLSQSVDLIIADMPSNQEADTEKIALKRLALQVRAGDKPVLFRLSESADHRASTHETLSMPAGKLAKGSDGVTLLPRSSQGALENFRQMFAGSTE